MADLTGQTLGRYQIVERLGRGGMADVYRGFQPGLDRYVAIKVMHPHLSEDADFITRFKREAQAVASLRHPNIVQVFDFDVQGENYYMAMDYIEGGRTLKELLEEMNTSGEKMNVEAAMTIIARLADALEYAHKRGMVHRDIKPSNVLVQSIDNPILSDFGIARLLDQSGLTASGAMIGTPAYMSPEQGRGETADERSDIYALGIVLYELVTGQPPYDADTPYGIILKHINDPLISPRTFIDTMPESVERVVLRALAKNPADRFPTAGAMRDAINRALEDMKRETLVGGSAPAPESPAEAVTMPGVAAAAEAGKATQVGGIEETAVPTPTEPMAAPPKIAKPAKAPGRSVRWLPWIIGLVVLAGVIYAGVTFLPGLFNPLARLEERAYSRTEEGDYDGAMADWQSLYEQTGDTWYMEQGAITAVRFEDLGRAEELYNRLLEETFEDPRYLVGMGYVKYRQNRLDETGEFVLHALALDPDRPDAHYLQGLLLRRRNRPEESVEVLSDLLRYEEDWEFAEPYFYPDFGHELRFDIALGMFQAGDLNGAQEMIDESLGHFDWWPQPFMLRAEIFKTQGQLAEAREALLYALEIAESDYPDMVPPIEEMLRNING